jgi:hypothetical protein
MKLAGELVIDAVVPGDRLRSELCARLERYTGSAGTGGSARSAWSGEARARPHSRAKKHLIPPV